MSFVPLRVHSQWSLLAGVPTVSELVAHAQANDLSTLALTDTNALYGAIEFVRECRAANLRSILGVDFTFDRDHTLVLLARNLAGYANLCRLVTRLQATPDRDAALQRGLALIDLAGHSRDLIALSDGHQAAALIEYFGRENVFIRLEETEGREAPQLADQLDLQVAALPDIRYLDPVDAARYRVLTAMRTGQHLNALPALPDRSFWPTAEFERRYAAYPAAVENTQRLADLCCFDFPLGQYRFPTLDMPPDRTLRAELERAAFEGARQRYGEITPAIKARLHKELQVINTLGYGAYFLVVADIVRFAREQRVPVSPRGSASSSVVAFCLGIHDVDPIAHNLYFERFLSLERRDPPDIDLDLCSHRRDEVISYVYQRYGADHVAMVCTYATLQPRSALREVAKVYGLPESRIGELAHDLPRWWHPAARQEAQDAQAQLLEKARDPIEREAIEMSQALTGAPHHLSVHPGGIVIAPDPITDLVPLQYATKGLLITQFDLKSIEHLGLIKIDLLGISALTVAADCVELIQEREPNFTLESIPTNDVKTIQLLAAAQTIGCFQIESPGMRFTLRELTARSIGDLIVGLALYRPGPLKGGLKDAFVRRHLGHEATDYLHPALEPILRETYGVILYQEQVLRIAHEVAGFSLGEADLVRRAMSKFRSAHEMTRLREQFLTGAERVSRMDAATAEKVWDLMAAFAGYGFPKAHAAGYAALAYRLAYLKRHYPAEFFAARLAVWGGFYSPRVYMSEARQLGLTVKPPHINHSGEAFTLDLIDRRTLWMGLGQVRELTHATTSTIMAQRPFTSLNDFLIRARPLHTEAINLIKANALEGLGNSAEMLAHVQHEPWHGRHSAQLSFALSDVPPLTNVEPTLAERVAWEIEVLGLAVSVHPLQLVAEQENVISSRALEQQLDRVVKLVGVRLAAHRFRSANQTLMQLIDMDDQDGRYQVLWSGEALREYRALLTRREPVIVQGRVRRDRQGQVLIVGEKIKPID
jgi:DNA-directed DNA polymerase III PolC